MASNNGWVVVVEVVVVVVVVVTREDRCGEEDDHDDGDYHTPLGGELTLGSSNNLAFSQSCDRTPTVTCMPRHQQIGFSYRVGEATMESIVLIPLTDLLSTV